MTQIEQQNVPKLRFSKFGDGEWSFATLADHLSAHQERVPANTDIPIYSSSRTGLKSQKDYFAGDELRNEGEYGVVPHGFFTYRHMSDDLTFKFNLNNLGHPIAVSKEYPVFETVELDPRFLLDWLNNSPHFSRFAAQQKLGGTRTRLYFKNLKTLRIHLPTLPEQRKIAGFLGAVDERIAQVTRKKALLEDYKKGCMQQLFSQSIRFKDDQGNDFPDWEEKPLGDIAKVFDGTHQTPKYVDKGVPFYSVEHVTANSFSNTKFIAEDVFIKENKRVVLERDDILLTRIGNIGTARLIDWDVRASFYVSLALVKVDEPTNSKYLAQAFSFDDFQRELWHRTIHVAFPKKINLGEISKCVVRLPHPDEQQKIADFLSAIDTKIDLVAKELEQTKTFKKGLLQQMFV